MELPDIDEINRVLRMVSFHEAGHVVVAMVLNVSVKEAYLDIITGGGKTIIDPPLLADEHPVKAILIAWAGATAEGLSPANRNVDRSGDDIIRINAVFDFWVNKSPYHLRKFRADRVDKLKNRLARITTSILNTNREVVIRVADALCEGPEFRVEQDRLLALFEKP